MFHVQHFRGLDLDNESDIFSERRINFGSDFGFGFGLMGTPSLFEGLRILGSRFEVLIEVVLDWELNRFSKTASPPSFVVKLLKPLFGLTEKPVVLGFGWEPFDFVFALG